MSKMLEELEVNLRERDDAVRPDRAQRFAELMLLGEPHGGRMLFGDCAVALWEAQWSYVNGQFLCTILTSQACVEKLLSGLVEAIGLDEPEARYGQLLRRAKERAILAPFEYEVLDRLRRTRNPRAHFRGVNHPEHPARRALVTAEPFDVQLRRDAQAAIHTLIHLANRGPFALGPIIAPFSAGDLLPEVHPDQMSLD